MYIAPGTGKREVTPTVFFFLTKLASTEIKDHACTRLFHASFSIHLYRGGEGEMTSNRMAVTCNLHGDEKRGKKIIIKI